ncbi:hypothetical protein [Bacteroidetes bacterium endosymbiont of Geopemphigus sp.]|uniref:hypothetical protein n=1 Tax=Bacteroidetes bacterium endosymbiont of Geopemphigus sp. TaxID=2047937 RepID=UPI000CD13020|nr:hypothetical protein [Bacteroidetes bacterium endosymbiont of Geopemphigus sp.]
MMAFSAPSETVIWYIFLKIGKPIRYNQSLDINYQLLIEALPFIDWFKTNLGYGVTYQGCIESGSAKTFG